LRRSALISKRLDFGVVLPPFIDDDDDDGAVVAVVATDDIDDGVVVVTLGVVEVFPIRAEVADNGRVDGFLAATLTCLSLLFVDATFLAPDLRCDDEDNVDVSCLPLAIPLTLPFVINGDDVATAIGADDGAVMFGVAEL
jgi:hypothetical protein